jgi:hypothetical protein
MGRAAHIYRGYSRPDKSDVHGIHEEHQFYLDSVFIALHGNGDEYLHTLTGSAGVQYIGLDNVNVYPTGAGAVPEPESYALIATGLG